MFDKLVELVIAKKHLPITYFLLLSFISNDLSLFISNGRFIFSCHVFSATTSSNLKCINVHCEISFGKKSFICVIYSSTI